jgi:hypothetical protein
MTSSFEWLLLIAFSSAVVLGTLLIALSFERQRRTDVSSLSTLGERLGMRYRVLGRDHLLRPEPFVLHERPGAAAENSLIERSLIGTRASGLPAIFEYVTYRDRMGFRRFGPPFLVLAARVPMGTPCFRLRPQGLLERFWNEAHGRTPRHAQTPPGWIVRIDGLDGTRSERPLPDMASLAASGLWMQVSGRTLFVAQPLRSWQCSALTPRGVQRLVRQALPVLRALDSPDAPHLETGIPLRSVFAQAAEG